MLCNSMILQRTTSLGYFKTLRELFGFHERTTSFYSSRVGRYHENFTWQVSSGGGGGFMKWEQTAGNIPIYSVRKPTKNQCCLKEPPNTGLNVAIFEGVNVRFGLGDPDILGMVYLKFGQQPNCFGNLYHGTIVGVSSPKVEI